MDWLTSFLDALSSDPTYVHRLRTDPVAAIDEIPGAPAELRAALAQGSTMNFPTTDDPCLVYKLWVELLLKLLSNGRYSFITLPTPPAPPYPP